MLAVPRWEVKAERLILSEDLYQLGGLPAILKGKERGLREDDTGCAVAYCITGKFILKGLPTHITGMVAVEKDSVD